jgi:hypothetical protein
MATRIIHALYEPSGGVRSLRLPVVLVVVAGTSIAIGAIYFTLLNQGWYLAALSVLIPVMLACGATSWGVHFCHCRNRVLAGALGASCGLMGLILYFHIDQCVRWHAPLAAVDRLPAYFAFRMQTDRWVPFAKGAILTPQAATERVEPAGRLALAGAASWNLRMLLLEALALALAPLAAGLHAAKKPYSERWRRWCDCESLFLEKKSAAAFRQALADGTIEEWIKASPHLVTDRQPHCRLKLWYAPCGDPDEGMTDVLLSIQGASPLRLKPREAAAFVDLLPALRTSTGAKPAGDPPCLREFDATIAHIWRVPKASRFRRFGLAAELRKLAKGLRIALPACAMMLIVTGGAWCLNRWVVQPGYVDRWILPAFVLSVGLPLAIWCGLRLKFQRLWQIYLDEAQRVVIDRIAARPDAIVRYNDPLAIYAEMLPRRLWESGRDIRAADSNEGLMRLDEERQAVVFEGENERFLLPVDSILSARIESLPGIGRAVEGLYCVVLRVRLAAITWELPFFPYRGLPAKTNWQRAVLLLAALEELCGRQLGKEAIEPSELEPVGR